MWAGVGKGSALWEGPYPLGVELKRRRPTNVVRTLKKVHKRAAHAAWRKAEVVERERQGMERERERLLTASLLSFSRMC